MTEPATDYLYAAEVHPRCGAEPGWPSFRRQLEAWEVAFYPPDYWQGSTDSGLYWWFDEAELPALPFDLPPPGGGCPFVGERCGVFCWLPFDELEPMLTANLHVAGGRLHRWTIPEMTTRGVDLRRIPPELFSGHRSMPTIVRRRARLSALLSKFGFDDGDALLCRDAGSAYLQGLEGLARSRLRELGVEPLIGMIGTSHNPLRFNLFTLPADGQPGAAVLLRADGAARSRAQLYDLLDAHDLEYWFHNLGDARCDEAEPIAALLDAR